MARLLNCLPVQNQKNRYKYKTSFKLLPPQPTPSQDWHTKFAGCESGNLVLVLDEIVAPTLLDSSPECFVRLEPNHAFYQGLLARGKAKKVALVACAHKLLAMCRAVVIKRWSMTQIMWLRSRPKH